MDIATWLNSLGLDRYKQAFEDNAIDFALLPKLTADDLRDIGITAVGHRRKLLEAIAALPDSSGAGTQTSEAPPASAVPWRDAERRQLTVMFVDLVGSTELSLKLDPEELREVSRAYQDATTREVGRFGGHVAKYMGDGVLVYFGYPQAHEDDAVRAIYAGLAVVRAVKHLGKRMLASHGGRLRARVGAATGVVVVGDLVGTEGSEAGAVTGETPNLAYRLQEAAGPGQVVVAELTRVLAGEAFKYEEPETRKLKGFPDPTKLWRVLGPSGAESRFEALHGRWLTPMVGREHEIALVMERWRQAKEGEGQVVLVSSEAGIGKSRITEVLRERVMAEEHLRIRLQCSPYHTNSALYPIVEHLERAAGFERDDTPEAKLDKLEALIGQAATSVAATTALLAPLLSIPTGERYPPLGLTPERQKERTLAALTDQVAGLAAIKPVFMIVEDAHWIDPTTLESIDLTIARVETLRVLVVITFRPEFQPKWLGLPHVTNVPLNRLSKRQVAEMVDGVTGGRALPRAVLDQIIARTDGVPLFVEELTRMVMESGLLREEGGAFVLEGPLPPMAIPSTLQDSLMARLDRLAPAKEVAQIGAVIGREFSYELLAAVATQPPDLVRQALIDLVKSQLVFGHGQPPYASYTFKHALVRDTAYRSLLRSKRLQWHSKIGQVMEERFPETANAQPELLAHHFTQAGLIEHAVTYWQKAGELAMARSAMVEAVAHLTQGLEALRNLPDTIGRQRCVLGLQVALGEALVVTKGFAFPETGRAWARAYELCGILGESEQLARILFGQAALHLARAEFERAREVGEELVRLGETQSDTLGQSAGHRAIGAATYHLGDLIAARRHLEEALALHDPAYNSAIGYSYDTRAVSLCYLSLVLAICGYLDQARARGCDALTRGRELLHPGSVGFAHSFRFIVYQYSGNLQGALGESEAYLAVAAEQQGIPMLLAEAKIMHGWALAETGQPAGGATQIREGLAAWLATRAKFYLPYFRAMLADAYGRENRPKAERLRQLEKAILQAKRTDWRPFEAGLYRQRGDVLASGVDTDLVAAQADFRRAIAIARGQGAKLWELRAAASLGRLLRDQGKHGEARDLLAPIYGWFTEGLDTPVLKEAKALLDEL